MKKDYTVLSIQLDGNLASDVSTRCSGRPHSLELARNGFMQNHEDDQSIWSKRRKLSSHQVESREPCNLSSPDNRLFGKYHAQMPQHNKDVILSSMQKEDGVVREAS